MRFPASSFFFFQFFKSKPIPPVTPTVVRKIGDTPLVPAITGAIFINGMYLLAFFPIQRATLLTPDILDEPTPMVPFSAISMTRLSGCLACNSNNAFCWSLLCSNIDCPCSCRSDLECASLPGDNKSVEISPIPATNVTSLISSGKSGSFVKNSALA